MNSVILSIGSNSGNRKEMIEKAISFLSNNGYLIIKQSHLIETKPYGKIHQNFFLNMALLSKTSAISPLVTLKTIKNLEQLLGRKTTYHWGPRVIDIDIIFWNQNVFLIPGNF